MSKDTTIQTPKPEQGAPDDLTDLLREGAKRLIAQAVDAELSATLAELADYKDDAGRRYVVRFCCKPLGSRIKSVEVSRKPGAFL